ncbi:choline dehydrogenase-like flavoprotein [Hoeflea marina]|uniref:Choline dehydrogenase-like flavoprotein n=2 Tax=Hoeflea marina TaxID=274592 RepID=A0A317PHX8_9HYPH|nr:choline dehydrogenase-like flavoprotein [Hoeflea marina]
MAADFDIIVIGSGPAGVSVSFPLVEAGLKVLMVDGGREPDSPSPSSPFLVGRSEDRSQWKWMIGEDFHALRDDSGSPKMRVPGHAFVFDGFGDANRIGASDYVAIGSLARGGLSNAWGCGVATLSQDEMREFPFPRTELEPSYAAVARRIGISGAENDDMADYFGLDAWADPPIRADALNARLLERYSEIPNAASALGFRLGRSRTAVLQTDRGARKACDLSGNCLWGCDRRSLYTATEDLSALKKHTNFVYRPGFVVEKLIDKNGWHQVLGSGPDGNTTYGAPRLALAAGTLASTRLSLQLIGHRLPVPMQACPSAAFMVWIPVMLGRRREPAFGLGQLSFAMDLAGGAGAFGSLFNPTGIPIAEFSRHMPFRKRFGIDILATLMSSCLAGNVFLPGRLSTATVTLGGSGQLHVQGAYATEVASLMLEAEKLLRRAFRRLGAVMLPGSFTIGRPGGDIHYAATLPMRAAPTIGETDSLGELYGVSGIHVVDGASLTDLTEKSHTLTIMANADRIGRRIVAARSQPAG